MPRYFFDTSDGTSPLIDKDGVVYANAQDARREALRALGDMAKDHIREGGNRLLSIVMRDHEGNRIYSAKMVLSEDSKGLMNE